MGFYKKVKEVWPPTKIKNEEFFRLGSCDCERNYRPIISAPYICLRDAKKQKSLNKISPYRGP